MKISICMSVSLNGITCLDDGSEDFLSKEGGQSALNITKKAGAMIWGRRTYEIVGGSFRKSLEQKLQAIPKVIVSANPRFKVSDNFLLASSPQAAINLLEAKGVRAAVVCGGSKLNTAFLQAGLVDEIIINVEPIIIGKGLPLFAPADFEVRTELINVKPVNKGELLLTYKVLKGAS
jgi:dihydrofolate reductase